MRHSVLNFDLFCFLMDKFVRVSPAGTIVINQECGLHSGLPCKTFSKYFGFYKSYLCLLIRGHCTITQGKTYTAISA